MRLLPKVFEGFGHPSISYAELEQAFPKDTQGTYGVFITSQNAVEIYASTGRNRYYIKPDELTKLKDAKMATCTQGRPNNINRFVEVAEGNGVVIGRK